MKKEVFILIIVMSIVAFAVVKLNDPYSSTNLSNISPTGFASTTSKILVINPDPNITTIQIFDLYKNNNAKNKPGNNISICNSANYKSLHFQFNTSDANGFEDVDRHGNVNYTIVFYNRTTVEEFKSFGSLPVSINLESGAGSTGIYHIEYNMSINDSRTNTSTNYMIRSSINDLETNVNLSRNFNFTFTGKSCDIFVNDSVEFSQDIKLFFNATNESGIDMNITPTRNFNGSISLSNSSTFAANDSSFRFKPLNKYIEISVTNNINESISEAVLTVFYTDAEVEAADLAESELRLYKWSGINWTRLPNNTVDLDHNFVTATTSNFSQFGVWGEAIVETEDTEEAAPAAAASAGGGGGSSSSPTGEAVADAAPEPTPDATLDPAAEPAPDAAPDDESATEEIIGPDTDTAGFIPKIIKDIPEPIKKTFNYTLVLVITLISLAVVISNVAVYYKRYEVGYAIRSNKIYQMLKLDVFSRKSRNFDIFRKRMELQRIKDEEKRKMLKSKITKWKQEGYDTTVLGSSLNKIKDFKVLAQSFSLEKIMDKWKKAGYDTRSLQSTIRAASIKKIRKKSGAKSKSRDKLNIKKSSTHGQNYVKKLSAHINKWKKTGYDTSILEHKLCKAREENKKIISIKIIEIKNKIKQWKSLGYDTSILEKKLRRIKKN